MPPEKPQPNAVTEKPETHLLLREVGEARQRQLMVAMWHRMGSFFGAAWESQYGGVNEQTISAWSGALAGFTVGELAGAIRACERWSGKFPPTFPEFRELCQTVRTSREKNVTQQRLAREAQTEAVPLADLSRRHPGDSTLAKAEKDRQAAIGTEGFPETFEESYHKLGLQHRWGPLPNEHSRRGRA